MSGLARRSHPPRCAVRRTVSGVLSRGGDGSQGRLRWGRDPEHLQGRLPGVLPREGGAQVHAHERVAGVVTHDLEPAGLQELGGDMAGAPDRRPVGESLHRSHLPLGQVAGHRLEKDPTDPLPLELGQDGQCGQQDGVPAHRPGGLEPDLVEHVGRGVQRVAGHLPVHRDDVPGRPPLQHHRRQPGLLLESRLLRPPWPRLGAKLPEDAATAGGG